MSSWSTAKSVSLCYPLQTEGQAVTSKLNFFVISAVLLWDFPISCPKANASGSEKGGRWVLARYPRFIPNLIQQRVWQHYLWKTGEQPYIILCPGFLQLFIEGLVPSAMIKFLSCLILSWGVRDEHEVCGILIHPFLLMPISQVGHIAVEKSTPEGIKSKSPKIRIHGRIIATHIF